MTIPLSRWLLVPAAVAFLTFSAGHADASRTGNNAHAPAASSARTVAQAQVMPVEPDKVCMVNNQHFGTVQIPVDVDGKTYYGCCEGCKATLAEDAQARTAVDPVSGRSVDKALAVIGAYRDGQVEYFENAENLEAWNRRTK